jgi:SRSO17 transposase
VLVTHFPKVLQAVFRWADRYCSRPQLAHLRWLVLALVMGGRRAKLVHVAQATAFGRHRTSVGHFLSRAEWDAVSVLSTATLRTLRRMKPVGGEELCLIIDDTRNGKRAKRMQAVSKIWDHCQQRFVRGHIAVTAALLFRGVVLPWKIQLWLPAEYCRAEGLPYRKMTEMAAAMVGALEPPKGMRVRVLFDAFYLCPTLTNACAARGWKWFSVASKNRTLKRSGPGKSGKLRDLGPGALKYRSRRVRMKRSRGWRWMQITAMDGSLSKLGPVRIVFSKRPGDRWKNLLAIATNDTARDPRQIVAIYEKRWSIEVLFKELQGTLGLGEYQMQKRQGIERHLHVVCLTHLVLTHHSLTAVGAQARKANTTVSLPPVSERLSALREEIRRDHVTRFANRIKNRRTRRRVREYLLAA